MIFLLLIPLIAISVLCNLSYKWNRQGTLVTTFSSTFFALLLTAVMFGLSFTFTGGQFDGFNVWVWLILVAKGFVWLFQVWIWVKAIKHVPISIATPLTLGNMLLLLGGSWLVFSDVITITQLILVFVIFGSCIMICMLQRKTEKDNNNPHYVRGIIYIFVWMSTAVTNTLGTRYVGDAGVSTFTYCVLISAMAFGLLIILMLACRYSIRETFQKSVRDKIQYGIGFTDIGTAYFYMPLAITMNLGVLDALLVSSTVITVLIGVIFMKEKLRWYVYPFIVIVIICNITLALQYNSVAAAALAAFEVT